MIALFTTAWLSSAAPAAASPASLASPGAMASPVSGAWPPCVQFDHPPTPPCGSTFDIQVGQTLTFVAQISDTSCLQDVTLDGAADTPGSTFTPPLPMQGNPATTTYSWTPQPGMTGQFHIVFHATSPCCAEDDWCNLLVNVAPPCPACVDPGLGLGAAAGCTVLELGPSSVSITGPAGGLLGDVCIAANGHLSMSGSEYITGDIRLGPGATFSNSSSGSIGQVFTNVDLSAEINAAYAAAASASARPCTQSYASLTNNQTITGNGGMNVVCCNDVVLNGKIVTLSGGASDFFILNVTGRFVLTGGGKILASGVPASHVLYNIRGTGADVAFSGGGGGINCCNARVDGTLLAPSRRIALSPGLVNGEVISALNISIVSGSGVHCPSCP
jgi:hypothetical protein